MKAKHEFINPKIGPREVNFYVDEEKRTVTCVLNGTTGIARSLIDKDTMWIPDYEYNMLVLPPRFVGKAVCSAEDTFDVDKGRLLAYTRAKYKLSRAIYKRVRRYVEWKNKELDKLNDSITSYFNKIATNFEYRVNRIETFCPGDLILPRLGHAKMKTKGEN